MTSPIYRTQFEPTCCIYDIWGKESVSTHKADRPKPSEEFMNWLKEVDPKLYETVKKLERRVII